MRGGYILVETVVAMAVLSISILGVHQGISQALLARARTMDFTMARFLMEEKLNDLLIQPQLTEGQGKGTFDVPHERFSYEWSLKKVEVPKPEMTGEMNPERQQYVMKNWKSYVGKISITISWMRAGEPFERTGETLIGPDKLWQPPQKEGGA